MTLVSHCYRYQFNTATKGSSMQVRNCCAPIRDKQYFKCRIEQVSEYHKHGHLMIVKFKEK